MLGNGRRHAQGRALEDLPMDLHRGRLIDHVQLVVKDLSGSRHFYEAVLGALGISMGGQGDGYVWWDELVISSAESQAAQGMLTGRVHLALQGKDRAAIEAFYRAGLAAGGRDNGAPGERSYHPGYRGLSGRSRRKQH